MTSHSCIYSLTHSREYLLCMCLPATPMRAVYKDTSTLCKVIIRHRQNVAIKACGCVYTRLQCDCTVPVHNRVQCTVCLSLRTRWRCIALYCLWNVWSICLLPWGNCYHGNHCLTVNQCSLPHACRSRATYQPITQPNYLLTLCVWRSSVAWLHGLQILAATPLSGRNYYANL